MRFKLKKDLQEVFVLKQIYNELTDERKLRVLQTLNDFVTKELKTLYQTDKEKNAKLKIK